MTPEQLHNAYTAQVSPFLAALPDPGLRTLFRQQPCKGILCIQQSIKYHTHRLAFRFSGPKLSPRMTRKPAHLPPCFSRSLSQNERMHSILSLHQAYIIDLFKFHAANPVFPRHHNGSLIGNPVVLSP